MNLKDQIYSHASYLSFLQFVSSRPLGHGGRPLSLRRWAVKLGYRSPRIIGMVLKGQRLPSPEMVRAWASSLDLESNEHRYLELLVLLERKKRQGRPLASVVQELRSLAPTEVKALEMDARAFTFISDWYHLVIKQLLSDRRESQDPKRLRARLNERLPLAFVRRAIDNMIRLGILKTDPVSGRHTVVHGNITVLSQVPSEALRMHHSQMLDRAKSAIENQASAEREITSATFRFNPARLAEAKAAIRRFREEFERLFHEPDGSEVYQLGLQFFSHTHGISTKKGD